MAAGCRRRARAVKGPLSPRIAAGHLIVAANLSYVEVMAAATPSLEPAPPPAGDPRAEGDNAVDITVSELAGSIKKTLETAYGRVRVRGELGRVTIAKSGHMYADMKDDRAVISAVMWRGQAAKLAFKPEEGLEVVAEGRLSTYPGRSQYQLIVDTMTPAGAGALMALLEARKKALAAEGLFTEERKRRLPFLPDVIGVVTSPTGAVIRDILHRLGDRFPRRVLVWPAVVQGDQAAGQIVAGIEGFNALTPDGPLPRPDVIIVARGGGSIEDLWAFNEEAVVRAAAASDIPLISAVGHETDWTLIDLAADKRAPTPTGAAEMAVPVRVELAAQLDVAGGRARTALTRRLERAQADLRAATRGLPRLTDVVGGYAQRLDAAAAALRAALKAVNDRDAMRFQRAAARLRPELLAREWSRRGERVVELEGRAMAACHRGVRDAQRTLAGVGARLEAIHPRAVLSRGYALARRQDGALARSAGALADGERLTLVFADGERGARVDGGAGDATPVSDAGASRKQKQRRSPSKGRGGQRELF